MSQPVALLLDESHAVESTANEAGFRYFVSVPAFKRYVLEDIVGNNQAAAD